MIRLLTVLLTLLLGLTSAAAQAPPSGTIPPPSERSSIGQAGSIKGRVILESGIFLSQAVRVSLTDIRGSQANLYSDNQGQFEITGLTPGDYTLEVEGDRLVYDVSTVRVEVRRGMPTILTVTLKEKSSDHASKPVGSVASVSELSADVPSKARAEFERASKAAKDGKTEEAITHLRRAIDLYPNFMMAHNDLGAQLLEQGKLDEATTELERALQIDSKAFNPNLNIGIVLVKQQRYSEAADALRKATALESTSPAAHFYLGLALKGMEVLDGAEAELKTAYSSGGADYSIALFELGDLYMKRGDRMLARQAFELYLRQSPNAANAAQARQLVSVLR